MRGILTIVVFGFVLSACSRTGSLTDVELANSLVGSWLDTEAYEGNVTLELRTNYHPGKTWDASGTLIQRGESADVIMSGSWKVEGGWLHTTCEASNIPDMIPNGYTSAVKILEVTEYSLAYEKDGHLYVEARSQ